MSFVPRSSAVLRSFVAAHKSARTLRVASSGPAITAAIAAPAAPAASRAWQHVARRGYASAKQAGDSSSAAEAKAQAYRSMGGGDMPWIIATLAVTLPTAYLMLQSSSSSDHAPPEHQEEGHHDDVKKEEDNAAEKAPEGEQESAKETSAEQAPAEESEEDQKKGEETDEKKNEDDQGSEKDGAKQDDKPVEDKESSEKESSGNSNGDEDPHGGLIKENEEAAGNERGPANEKPSDDSNGEGEVKKNEVNEELQDEITPTHDMNKEKSN